MHSALQKVQVATTEAKPDLSHMSLQEMKDQKISFGKTHHGRTFQDMWDNEQSWTTWFVQRYSNSGKAEHMVFLKFVELMVERAELTGQGVPLTNQKEVEKTRSLTGAPGLSAGSEPRGQGQSQGDGDGTHPDVPVGLRRRPGDLRDALGDSSNPGECQDHELGESHAGGRDCAGKYPSALGGHESDHGHPTVRDQECPSLAAQTFAGDVSAECFASETQQETPETNHERKLFNKFVQQYTTELSQIQNNNQQSWLPSRCS